MKLLGYRYTFFTDPRAALDAFRTEPEKVDVVCERMHRDD